jgi:hypothetical protein
MLTFYFGGAYRYDGQLTVNGLPMRFDQAESLGLVSVSSRNIGGRYEPESFRFQYALDEEKSRFKQGSFWLKLPLTHVF